MSWQHYDEDANAAPSGVVRLTARLRGPVAGPDLEGVAWRRGSGSGAGAESGSFEDAGEEKGVAEEPLARLAGRVGRAEECGSRPTVRLVETE